MREAPYMNSDSYCGSVYDRRLRGGFSYSLGDSAEVTKADARHTTVESVLRMEWAAGGGCIGLSPSWRKRRSEARSRETYLSEGRRYAVNSPLLWRREGRPPFHLEASEGLKGN